MRRPGRRAEVIGLLAGLAVGFCVAGWLVFSGGSAPPPDRAAATATDQPAVGEGSAGREPDPAALDAEWAASSDRSGCADWAGGDGISAVRLNSSQLAWFFSDTYLGPAGPSAGFSRSSGFAHNTVVIQTTAGTGSKFVTMTGGGACTAPGRPLGPPSSVVAPGGPADRYWDEDGVVIGGTVVKFYNRYLPGGVPFIPAGTAIATFGVAQLSAAGHGPAYGAVARPSTIVLPAYTPPSGGAPIVWGAALLRSGGTIYVYGTQSPDPAVAARGLYLARVRDSQLTRFSAWQFYAGDGRWATGQQNAQPVQPAGSGFSVSSGFSVLQIAGRYWLIQAGVQAGSQDIDAYPAAEPWGPFGPSAGLVLFRNTDIGLDAAHDYRIMYEARAEPGLSTSHMLVISYNVNSAGVTTGCVPMSAFTNTVTQPKFITVPVAAFAAPATSGPVQVGPSDYPQIAVRAPGQWFNGWQYRGGCPPVPGLTGVRTQTRPGAATLTWPDAGLGVRYQVYLLAPASGVLRLVKTVQSDGVTITGLSPGTYQAQVTPANFRQQTGPPARVQFQVP